MRFTLVAFCTFVLLAQVSSASASVTFYNQSGEPVRVTTMMSRGIFSNSCWSSFCGGSKDRQLGWWSIYPGNNALLTNASWNSFAFFGWLAEGTIHTWSGSVFKCIPDVSHDRCSTRGGAPSSCPSGETRLGYRDAKAGECCGFCGSGEKSFILGL